MEDNIRETIKKHFKSISQKNNNVVRVETKYYDKDGKEVSVDNGYTAQMTEYDKNNHVVSVSFAVKNKKN